MEDEDIHSKENNTDRSTNVPKANNALLGILSNALNSSMKQQKNNAGLETKRCPTCSAARPADSDLQQCAFCGSRFF